MVEIDILGGESLHEDGNKGVEERRGSEQANQNQGYMKKLNGTPPVFKLIKMHFKRKNKGMKRRVYVGKKLKRSIFPITDVSNNRIIR